MLITELAVVMTVAMLIATVVGLYRDFQRNNQRGYTGRVNRAEPLSAVFGEQETACSLAIISAGIFHRAAFLLATLALVATIEKDGLP